jgi:hypothetical protein
MLGSPHALLLGSEQDEHDRSLELDRRGRQRIGGAEQDRHARGIVVRPGHQPVVHAEVVEVRADDDGFLAGSDRPSVPTCCRPRWDA